METNIENLRKSKLYQSVVQNLSAERVAELEGLETFEEVDKFIQIELENRNNDLKECLDVENISKEYVIDSIDDLTPENLRQYHKIIKAGDIQEKLQKVIDLMIKNRVSHLATSLVVKRNKRNENGTLDTFLTLEEHNALKQKAIADLSNNPTYKNAISSMNTSRGTIRNFNEAFITIKRDYEISKELYCNTKGMTPESFDAFIKACENKTKEELDENGLDNKGKATPEWYSKKFKELYVKSPYFDKEKIEDKPVYKSRYLEVLDEMDSELLSKSNPNSVTGEIVSELDKMSERKALKVVEDLFGTSGEVGHNRHRTKRDLARETLLKKKNIKPEIKKESVFDDIDIGKEDIIEKQEPVSNPEIPSTNIRIEEEVKPEPVIIERNPEDVLKEFRSSEVENKVLIKYQRDPDISILKNITDPKLRLTEYKRSAVRNGFRLYLPNSGYNVIVKKILDGNQLNYLFSLLTQLDDIDMSTLIEQETLRILYENLEFPDFTVVTYSDFIKHFASADFPILMMAFALTNIKEDKDGRIKLNITDLICSNCGANIRVKPISIDVKDFFSKMYPIKKFASDYSSRLNGTPSIKRAFRTTDTGKFVTVSYNSNEELPMKYLIILSTETMYKKMTLDNQINEISFEVIKEDVLERAKFYESKYGADGLDEKLKDLTYKKFVEEEAIIQNKVESIGSEPEEVLKTLNDETKDELATLAIIKELVNSSRNALENVFTMCRYIDGIKLQVPNTDGEYEDLASADDHDKLIDIVNMIASLPTKLIKSINDAIAKIETVTDDKEHDVYYSSEDIRNKISPELIKYYGEETKESYIEFLKKNNPDITKDDIENALIERNKSYDNLNKSHCVCGNDVFRLNYTSIVFFSMFNRQEVIAN